MNADHKEWLSVGLTLLIWAFAFFVIEPFVRPWVWAAVIAIASYPLYQRWRVYFGSYQSVAALLFTLLIVLMVVLPLTWLASVLIKEFQVFFNYVQTINQHGAPAPDFLRNIPWVGPEFEAYWDKNFADPGHVKDFLANAYVSMSHASHYIKQIGYNVAHRSIQIGFSLLALFFFYRDGDALLQQIHHIGVRCLGERWHRYANQLPVALRSTVNGTIMVGLGVGLLMGICYAMLQFPAPTLAGFLTAFASMIPFLVPVVFGTVALIFVAKSSMLSAIIVLVWGTLVMFFADHFVKPALIGGAIQLPFLMVLFGILGGVEMLGLLGLFVGPIVMVLFMTLWKEMQVA